MIKTKHILRASEAVQEAKQQILRGITEEQLGLKTRWTKVNTAIPGGFQFNNNILLAGLSGHGKSYLMNMLRDDFLNPAINGAFKEPFNVLFFTFEMSAADEMLRTLSGKVSKDYADLLSLRHKMSRPEFDMCMMELDRLADYYKRVQYVQMPSTAKKMKERIQTVMERHGTKLVIMLDHTLLIQGENEVEKLAEYSKMNIEVRQEYSSIGTMIFNLGQLKESVKRIERLNKEEYHYPTDSDIFGSKQMYHAMDIVIAINQPALYNISSYGPNKLRTELDDGRKLLAFHVLKQRKGESNQLVQLEANLDVGQIHEWIPPAAID